MRFTHTNSYQATPDAVLAMLTSAEFREKVCEAQHAVEHTVEVSGSGAGATVVIAQTQAMDGAPAVARRLTGDTVAIVQREEWGAGPTAVFAMEIPGKPGHLRGTAELRATDGGCDEVFSGEVKVSVPLVGGRLEGAVADILRRALTREGQVGASWLEDRRGHPMNG
jgi:hypothetical protein